MAMVEIDYFDIRAGDHIAITTVAIADAPEPREGWLPTLRITLSDPDTRIYRLTRDT